MALNMQNFDPEVFLSAEGCVAVVPGNAQNAGFSVSVSSLSADSAYDNLKSIVTSVSMNEMTNVQFTPTLDKSIFMYVFGDQISSLDVSGVCFLAPQRGGVSGVTLMKDFYAQNKVSTSGKPIAVTLSAAGGQATSFNAFLTGGSFSANDPQNMLGSFSLKLSYMP
jgi:hypothetical protein